MTFVQRIQYVAFMGTSGLGVVDSLPERLEQEYDGDRASNLVIVYVECQSPGSGDLRIIPENRSP
jgi:hypothetical protein